MSLGMACAGLPTHFWLRRLHSLSGVVPLGLFLLEHLLSNATAVRGPEAYDRMVAFLRGLPLLPLWEVGLIALPLLFHAGLGIYLTTTMSISLRAFPTLRNWLYVWQRITGVIALLFVLYHVWEFRIRDLLFGAPVKFTAVAASLAHPVIFGLYLVGTVATVFHLCNGIATFSIVWGLTITESAQRRMGIACAVGFVLLTGVGVLALFSFR